MHHHLDSILAGRRPRGDQQPHRVFFIPRGDRSVLLPVARTALRLIGQRGQPQPAQRFVIVLRPDLPQRIGEADADRQRRWFDIGAPAQRQPGQRVGRGDRFARGAHGRQLDGVAHPDGRPRQRIAAGASPAGASPQALRRVPAPNHSFRNGVAL